MVEIIYKEFLKKKFMHNILQVNKNKKGELLLTKQLINGTYNHANLRNESKWQSHHY